MIVKYYIIIIWVLAVIRSCGSVTTTPPSSDFDFSDGTIDVVSIAQGGKQYNKYEKKINITNNYNEVHNVNKGDNFFITIENPNLIDSIIINNMLIRNVTLAGRNKFFIHTKKDTTFKIQAYYAIEKYKIETDDSISVSTKNASCGDTIKYYINNYEGKQFNKLTINGAEFENKGYFIMPDTSVYVKAFYVPLRKQMNIIAMDSHIKLYVNSAYEGEAVHFGITENEGFSLKNVVINGVKFDKSTRSFVMEDKDVEIALEYEINITDDYKGYDVENVTLDDCHVKTIFYHGKISQRKYISKLNGKTVKIEFYDEFGKLKNTITY